MRGFLNLILGLLCLQTFCYNKETENEFEKDVDSFKCNYFCDTPSNDDNDYIPPAYNDPCCPAEILPVYVTGPEKGSIRITWTEPQAFDMNGTLLRNEQVIGAQNGSYFNGSVEGIVYNIVYIATDENGLKDSCYFNFTVYESMNCTSPNVVNNGRYQCTNGTMPGSTCKYTCNEGYILIGDKSITCLSDGQMFPYWSGNPDCEAVKCSVPIKPENGDLSCQTTSLLYRSVCHVTCEKGFTPEGPLIMICQANGLWSRPTLCTFPESLAVNCISPQIFYTSPLQTSLEGHWKVPTSAAIDKNITRLYQTEGPSQGDILDIGRYKITYKISTYDSEKTAECDVQLYIKAVSCGEPSKALNDSNMLYNCSQSTFIHGSTCLLSCKRHTELTGDPAIICVDNGMKEGIWNWVRNEKPSCNDTMSKCHQNIKEPVNGKLFYYDNVTSPIAQVICDSGFDLNYGFSGFIFCSDGQWEYGQNLECNAKEKPNFVLKVKLKFFGQGCSENSSKYYDEYKETFKKEFEDVLSQNCSNDITCRVDNVEVECSNTSNSKTKDLFYFDHLFSIGFTIGVEVANETSEDSIVNQTNIVTSLWRNYRQWVVSTILGMLQVNGDFVVGTWEIDNYTAPVCKHGYMLSKQQCRTCSIGTYFNQTLDACLDCHFGYYKDEVSLNSCIACPNGSSTKTIGSITMQDCKDFCSPGSFSSDGLVSCIVCPEGYYQDMSGQTECKRCPEDTTTVLTNSTHIDNCTAILSDNRCMTSSCNGHRCLDNNGSYICVCSDGWSGVSCEEPPNPCSDNACLNGGKCINTNNTYECDCQTKFSGLLCEAKEENGGWTEWSRWSECSATCGQGIKHRTRQCRNPLPSKYGDQCVGFVKESKICDMDSCNECPRLIDGKNSYLECKTHLVSGLLECSVRCNEGFVTIPAFNGFMNITCALQTGLLWLPANVVTTCVEPVYPSSLLLESSIEYLQRIPLKFYESASEQVRKRLQSTDCLHSSTCNVDVTLLEQSLNDENDAEDITKLQTFFENAVEANDLLLLKSKIRDMEKTALSLEENTSFIFDIRVNVGNEVKTRQIHPMTDSRSYKADTATIAIRGTVSCLPGQIPYNTLCITCPPGTFATYNRCHLCFKGTFQSYEGKTRCTLCPAGLTTHTVGSYHELQCVEEMKNLEEQEPEDKDAISVAETVATILGSIAGAVAVLVTTAIAVL